MSTYATDGSLIETQKNSPLGRFPLRSICMFVNNDLKRAESDSEPLISPVLLVLRCC
jgi:hypothetical protein